MGTHRAAGTNINRFVRKKKEKKSKTALQCKKKILEESSTNVIELNPYTEINSDSFKSVFSLKG